MSCDRYTDPDVAARYVGGQLDEGERDAFELHYFECEACLADVQALTALRDTLAARPHRGAGPVTLTAPAPAAWSTARWLGLAATILLPLTLWYASTRVPGDPVTVPGGDPTQNPAIVATPAPTVSGQTAPSPTQAVPAPTVPAEDRSARLSRLAAFTAPAYAAIATRQAPEPGSDAFDAAMRLYKAQNYRDAAAALRNDPATQNRVAAQFYLGVSELLAADADAAAAETALRRAIALATPPYSDEAYFYLAKAAVRRGAMEEAELAAAEAVKREAGPRGDAERLWRELRAMRAAGR
jgi:hypothetical protein